MTRHAFLAKKGLFSTTKRIARGFGRTRMMGTSHCNKTQNYGKKLHQHLLVDASAPLPARKNAAAPSPAPAQPPPSKTMEQLLEEHLMEDLNQYHRHRSTSPWAERGK
jgi:hypothetical protein